MKATISGRLGPREIEVLRGIAREESIADLAARLHIAKGSVRSHIRGIYQKLGVGTREDAVRIGRQLGHVTDACPTCGHRGPT
jgi:ATP/maltotriose-dependent transcriptional regulator MalT